MLGYYIVFIATCIFFFLSFLISLKVKGSPIASKSYIWDVVRSPSREWKKIYYVMFADGIVSGVCTNDPRFILNLERGRYQSLPEICQ